MVESTRSYPHVQYGYFHGRFQPFHFGHLYIVQTSLQEVDELVIGISNPFRQPAKPENFIAQNPEACESLLNARKIENNPWSMWERCFMIREGLRCEGIDLSRIIFMPNLSNTGIPALEAHPSKESMYVYIYGKDKHNKASEQRYVTEGFKVKAITSKEFSHISSTKIRKLISENKEWEPLVPKGTVDAIKYIEKFRHISLS